MTTALAPLDARTLRRMLRYGLASGADRLELRPGRRPWVEGLGGPRPLRWRQLTGDDTRAALGALFAASRTPERVRGRGGDGARAVAWLVHWPGEALFEVRAEPACHGYALAVDILRPLPEAPASDATAR